MVSQHLSNNKDVSENYGYPQIIHFNRFSTINHPFWGTTIFGNTHKSPTLLLSSPGFPSLVWTSLRAWQHWLLYHHWNSSKHLIKSDPNVYHDRSHMGISETQKSGESHLQYIKRNTNTHFFFEKKWRLNCLESELAAKIAKNPSKDLKGPWEKSTFFWSKMLRNHSWHPRSCTCNMRGSCQLAVSRHQTNLGNLMVQLYNPTQLIHINITKYVWNTSILRSHSDCSTKNWFEEQSRTVHQQLASSSSIPHYPTWLSILEIISGTTTTNASRLKDR